MSTYPGGIPEYGQRPVPGRSATGRQYAPWGARAFSFFIDTLPVLAILGIDLAAERFMGGTEVITRNLGDDQYQITQTHGPSSLIGTALTVAWIGYWFWNKGYLEGKTGKSLGKRLTHEVTLSDATGKPLGVGWGCLRALLVGLEFVLGFCLIGLVLWLWPAWDIKRQALLSDKLPGAVVFRD